MDMKEKLQRFINESLLRGSDEVAFGDSLIERGVIDSVGVMQLITFIEDEAGVRIPDQLRMPNNFDTIDSMDEMIRGLRDR